MKIEDIRKYCTLKRSAIKLESGAADIKKFMLKEPVRHALEIGTFTGTTSAWMSQFCKELTTMDLLDGRYENFDKLFNWKRFAIRQKLWEKLGIKNIYFQPVKCNHSKERIIKNMVFDFAFIDGDHRYEGVKLDFELVKHCGRALFHDYDKAPGKACPVRDFINTIKDGKIETTKDFAYWTNK